MAANTFDFKEVTVIFDGNIISGFADTDDAIQVEAAADEWEIIDGADSEVMRHSINSSSCEVTLTLMPTSASNAILQALLDSRRTYTLSIRDARGSYDFSSENAFVARKPDVSLGKKPADREWMIRCMSYTQTVAGISDGALG